MLLPWLSLPEIFACCVTVCRQKINRLAKRNFATSSDLSVEIKGKVFTSKVLRHMNLATEQTCMS